MKKLTIDWKLITLLLVIVLAIVFIKLHDQNNYVKTKNGIEKHRTFSVAKVLFYKPYTFWGTGDGAASDITITYKYRNKHFEGTPIDPKVEKVKVNDNYIVMFDSTNLKRCVVLYNYPVTDSLQFLKDVEYLKKNPPTLYYESLIWNCLEDKEKLW